MNYSRPALLIALVLAGMNLEVVVAYKNAYNFRGASLVLAADERTLEVSDGSGKETVWPMDALFRMSATNISKFLRISNIKMNQFCTYTFFK